MGLIRNALSKIRKDDPRLLRIPPYLSLLCVLGGIAWIFLLPLNEYSRRTYISENALLPGQVHTYFGGSEQSVFRAYRSELATVLDAPSEANVTHDYGGDGAQRRAAEERRSAKIQELFHNAGVKTATQRYSYSFSGRTYEGENVYAVLHAPRGDGTEAIVLIAALENIDGKPNVNGVPLLITLAKYFRRWSLWSKDIIFVITPDSSAGPQAWVDAYHSTHDPTRVEGLPLKSGALQGVVCIDYPFQHRFADLHVAYDGINGALPNLDLINTAITIASGQMGIGASIQFQHEYTDEKNKDSYPSRLQVVGRGMVSQAIGHATGPHSVFMSYHIDAITLTAIKEGWQDEMAFGRTVESICRSLNNLLEKLHQSFFFYLMIQCHRFVSIGTYLPSAMAIAAAYTIMAIYLWILSGYDNAALSNPIGKEDLLSSNPATKSPDAAGEKDTGSKETILSPMATKPKVQFKSVDRKLILPIALVAAIHLATLGPFYLLTNLGMSSLTYTFSILALFTVVAPVALASGLENLPRGVSSSFLSAPTSEQYVLIKSLSLLILGLFLTVLSTLNFSLSTFLGLICLPLAFVDRSPTRPALTAFQYAILSLMSPTGLVAALCAYSISLTGGSGLFGQWLERLAFGWNIWGSWGVPVGVLCIWLPAWFTGALLVASSWFSERPTTTLPPSSKGAAAKS